MKSIKLAVYGLLAATLTLVGCQPAQAVEVGLSYADNEVLDKQGAKVTTGSEYKNLRYGMSVMASEDQLESYGVYAGIPLRIQGTQLEVTPMVTTEYYDEAKEFVGGVGIGLGFRINETLVLEATGTTNRSFDSSGYRGEVYSVGLVKKF